MTDPTQNYHGHNDTSAAAYKRATNKLEERCDAILAALAKAPHGLTGEGLEDATGITHQSIGGLIIKLMQDGKVHRPGIKHRTRSGAWALLIFHGHGPNVARMSRDDKNEARLVDLERFANAIAATIRNNRIHGEGLQGMRDALTKLGFQS
ncbi:MAG TPA: hypothetical protein VFH61_08115 [Thermoleophilia bacterium]|nr:hypothetical protein [Thermoleophilia bacterium]